GVVRHRHALGPGRRGIGTDHTIGMNSARRSRLISLGAFAVGAILSAATLYYVDFHLVAHMGRRLAVALLLSLVASGVWHLARTWAWAWCFPKDARISFLR